MRNGLPDGVIVLDLPPILTSDDGATILPHVDCIVLVAAVGLSKTADVEQCAAQLRETNVVRVVVNKALEKSLVVLPLRRDTREPAKLLVFDQGRPRAG